MADFCKLPLTVTPPPAFYQSDVEQQGFVMNLSRLCAWRREVCEAFGALRTQLTGNSTLCGDVWAPGGGASLASQLSYR